MSEPAGPVLDLASDGPVRILHLNRPDALNAADEELHSRLATIWDELAADPECRVVVLTGRGRAFCAGGDMGVLERMHGDPTFRDRTLDEARRIVHALVHLPVPLITAVNGPAVGLGCSLAALSDVVFIEEQAYFADPHVSVGLVAADGGALTWPLLTSLLRAKEYLFSGDRISAQAAVELGLANHVVAEGTSLERALDLARRLAAQPAQALRDTKRAINKHLERAVVDVLDFAIHAEWISSASDEHAARVAAIRARSATR